MGLDIAVGYLAERLLYSAVEPEGLEWFRNDLAAVNRLLVGNGLPPHQEPEEFPHLGQKGYLWLGAFPYDWLHYLRRAVAHSRHASQDFQPLREGDDPFDDLWVYVEETETLTSHLICHSHSEGCYVPIDFPEPLRDSTGEVTGGILGSSYGALRELIQVAPLLGIQLKDGVLSHAHAQAIVEQDESHPFRIERQVWLALYEAMERSIALNSLVVFC